MTQLKKVNFPAIAIKFKDSRELDRDLLKELGFQEAQLTAILDRGISFDDNVDVRIVTFTSNGVADTEDAVAHTLGKIPQGFFVINVDKAGIVYDGGTAWTTTAINLKTNVATAIVKIMVF